MHALINKYYKVVGPPIPKVDTLVPPPSKAEASVPSSSTFIWSSHVLSKSCRVEVIFRISIIGAPTIGQGDDDLSTIGGGDGGVMSTHGGGGDGYGGGGGGGRGDGGGGGEGGGGGWGQWKWWSNGLSISLTTLKI